MKPLIAIVGRPNVGKSTLFNRILGRNKAIVEDRPGVTRDRHYSDSEHGGRAFVLVDTGGFDPEAGEGMLALMKRQVAVAVEEADALVVVVDATEGLTPVDETVWGVARAGGKNIYLAANKLDAPSQNALIADFYRLGVD
ncbi:MAG: GTP-binding protein, partial [Deltaproteobacteria bacterium]|nr:GTP-binding protein [Deltaproteobacteria bacterium]